MRSHRLRVPSLLLAMGLGSPLIGCNGAVEDPLVLTAESQTPCTNDDPFVCAPRATPAWARALEPRAADGSGNNLRHPAWGAAGQPLRRYSTVSYTDGVSSPARDNGPNPRLVSSAVSAQTGSTPNSVGASDLVWQWGQFLDHDLDLSTDPNDGTVEVFDIAVPTGDPYFDPYGRGGATIPLSRSGFIVGSAPRQQLNKLTSFIDASNVYGSDAVRAAALRAKDGTGRLKTSAGNLLPFNSDNLPNANGPVSDPRSLFVAGDVRANEQVGLTSIHTLWMREHNRIAGLLHAELPQLTDEQIYQTARTLVIAEIQHITYDHWLPILIGADGIEPYSSYDSHVDATVENLFTNLYRVGHTLLSPSLLLVGNDGGPVLGGNIALKDAFFKPDFFIEGMGIDPVLLGQATQRAQEIDPFVVDAVRNFLFGQPGQGGLDLVSLNLQRGRDHGLPSYNQARLDYGLDAVSRFSQISRNRQITAKLASVYRRVDDVDPWIGALSEDHVPGAMVGPLLQAVIGDQFARARDGDRFWYERYLPQYLVEWTKKQTLAMVIKRNTAIGGAIQADAFRATR
jgi:peroxidase